jgi:hypothetical protein
MPDHLILILKYKNDLLFSDWTLNIIVGVDPQVQQGGDREEKTRGLKKAADE